MQTWLKLVNLLTSEEIQERIWRSVSVWAESSWSKCHSHIPIAPPKKDTYKIKSDVQVPNSLIYTKMINISILKNTFLSN